MEEQRNSSEVYVRRDEPFERRISRYASLLLLAVLALINLTACQIAGPNDSGEPDVDLSQFAMDTTVGSYGAGRENQLILVTIDLDKHAELINMTSSIATGVEQSSGIVLPKRYASLMNDWSEQYGIKRVANWPIPTIGVSCLIFESASDTNLQTIADALNELPVVDIAQPVQNFSVLQDQGYNDPFVQLQHAVHTMQTEILHRWTSGQGVTVAVIDTGVDTTHPEIAENVKRTFNFVDSDEEQFRFDIHGTAVAGVIAAKANNASGMVGIAPQAEILPIKACWHTGDENDGASCNSITLLKALDRAIREQADVINLSLAGPSDPLLEQLVNKALELDIVVVGARSPDDADLFPANVQGTISVSQSRDSTLGIIKAPGNYVLSIHPTKDYDFFFGSSFSTAHISALSALLRQLDPELSPSDVKSLIKETSEPTGVTNACRAVGSVVNADLSVCNAQQ